MLLCFGLVYRRLKKNRPRLRRARRDGSGALPKSCNRLQSAAIDGLVVPPFPVVMGRSERARIPTDRTHATSRRGRALNAELHPLDGRFALTTSQAIL
jgi:hypothetical protein